MAPLSLDVFFNEVFGRHARHISRQNPAHFTAMLPDAATVDELLRGVADDPSAIRAARGEQHRNAQAYRRPDGGVDGEAVDADLTGGYTIVLDCLERHLRSVGALSHALEVELNYATQVNAYLTPPHSAGFLPHYDHHDIMVLQMSGSKTWHLYGDAVVAPHHMQRRRDGPAGELPSPTELVVRAGDTLYLPSGQIHAAQTGAELSIHLSVGLHVPSVLTLLTHMLQELSLAGDRLHTRLPPRHLSDPEVRAAINGIVGDALAMLGTPAAVTAGLNTFDDLLARRGRCPPVGSPTAGLDIDDDTLLRRHRPLYSRVVTTAGRAGLQFGQLLVSNTADHEPAMRFLSTLPACDEPFRAGELPGLTRAQRVELVRTLLTSGFLVRCGPRP